MGVSDAALCPALLRNCPQLLPEHEQLREASWGAEAQRTLRKAGGVSALAAGQRLQPALGPWK